MKIICLIKLLPDIENIQFDEKKKVLMRENTRLITNPDDETALAAALMIKEQYPETVVEIVSMAPQRARVRFEDLLRRDVDKGVLISDPLFVGSDTYVTSRILSKYLNENRADCIFTGTHSLDGDTSHVPSQVAEALQMAQMSHVLRVDTDKFAKGIGRISVNMEGEVLEFELDLPAVLSFEKSKAYKMPYIRYQHFQLDVTHKMEVLTSQELQVTEAEVGLTGSLTEVRRTFMKEIPHKENLTVPSDDDGIETVYQFLKEKGYV